MSTPPNDVLIVGAGPTGLSAAILLGRAGVRTRVLTRHHGTATHPKAHFVNARTMEILRQWGLAEAVAEAALPPELGTGMGWMTRMNGLELGRVMVDDDPVALGQALEQSSEIPRSCPQSLLEPLLLAAAEACPSVTIEFATEVESVTQDDTGVTATARSRADGVGRDHRASYLIGADGAHSTVRRLLGIPAEPHIHGHVVGVHFTADLSRWQLRRPFLLWWIVNPDSQGVFIALDGRDRWVYLFHHDFLDRPAEHFTPDRCEEIVRRAVGAPDQAVDVLDASPWQMETAIADRFRDGRILLAGDAAHRFPPTGGFGMNTGVQDAHNLAWKLTHVLRGAAGAALLDTYEVERRPVALANAEHSVRNAERMATTGVPADPSTLRDVEDTRSREGAALRARLSAAIPAQREHLLPSGQTFGHVYDSTAVVPDGSAAPESTVSVYRPAAHPGALAPHLWLRAPSGRRAALVDLVGDRFTVLTGPEGQAWENAAARVNRDLGLDVAVVRVGPGCPWSDEAGTWHKTYEVEPSGCVLVRPDGHVAMRGAGDPGDAYAVLTQALTRVLAR